MLKAATMPVIGPISNTAKKATTWKRTYLNLGMWKKSHQSVHTSTTIRSSTILVIRTRTNLATGVRASLITTGHLGAILASRTTTIEASALPNSTVSNNNRGRTTGLKKEMSRPTTKIRKQITTKITGGPGIEIKPCMLINTPPLCTQHSISSLKNEITISLTYYNKK